MTDTTPIDPRFAAIRKVGGDTYAAYLAAGYREHYYRARESLQKSPYLLQKAIWRDDVKLYYVNVWAFDHSAYLVDHPFGLMPEVQYNTHGNQDPTFNVTYMGGDLSPEAVETFFATIYDRMQCEPYGD